jgi:hypothetical protein
VSGDDGLTQKLTKATKDAFRFSPDFTRSYGMKPGTLVVYIPTNVDWKDIGKRTKVFYTVEFKSTDDRIISTIKGSCWDGEYAECANQILRGARLAARKLQ